MSVFRNLSVFSTSALIITLASSTFAQEATTGETQTPEAAITMIENADRDTVLATVNGTTITLGQMITSYAELPPQYKQLPPDYLFEALLEQLVQQQLLSDALTEEPARLKITLDNQHRSLRAGEKVTEITKAQVTDEAIQAAYEDAYVNAEPTQEFNASHILVATMDEATAVLDRIEQGEPFEDIAKEVSTDPGSGAQGGMLGWFGEGQMVPEFEAGAKALDADEISAPIESQFGFHIIRLNETRDKPVPPLNEVRGEIEAQLQETAITAALAELESTASIEKLKTGSVDPALILDLGLLEDATE